MCIITTRKGNRMATSEQQGAAPGGARRGGQRRIPRTGLVCPKCRGRLWWTTNVWRRDGCLRRRRTCRACAHVITTLEYREGEAMRRLGA